MADPDADRLKSAPQSAIKARILAAALDLFAEHGVSGTSLGMIAKAVGVAKASVYFQFKTKDEIIIATTEMQLAQLEDALEAAEAAENRTQARELLLNRVIELAVTQRHMLSILQFDPVVIRFLAEHKPFLRFNQRLYHAMLGEHAGTDAHLQAATLVSAIATIVKHPLVADVDDETLRDHVLHLTRRLIDLPD